MSRMRSLLMALVLVGACGGRPPVPPRGVVEADVGAWKFRRFQGPLLDVEVWIPGNQGEAFSASYITADAEKRGRIDDKDLVNVTVTRYERPDGVVRETVKLVRRLAQDKGYQVDETKIEGVRALSITGPSEAWVMWPSEHHVVKVGGQGRVNVPASMIESYGERYPSKLPGGALEGALPPGPEATTSDADGKPAPYDPANPKPNLDRYDPDRVKLPGEQDGPRAPADEPRSTKKSPRE